MKKKSDKAPQSTPQLDPVEQALFRQEMTNVRPLHHDGIELPPKRPPPSRRRVADREAVNVEQTTSAAFDNMELEIADELLFVRSGIQHRQLQKLRRGEFSISATLDLHGKNVAVASQALANFLDGACQRGERVVHIIHGKGYRSQNRRSVLKSSVNSWLQQRSEVLAFCSAQAADGGTGALYVLLKKL